MFEVLEISILPKPVVDVSILPNQAPEFLTAPADFELLLNDIKEEIYEYELPPTYDLNGDEIKVSIEKVVEVET